ncbi:MAG: membrane protein insertase YidC [Gammaproteobacteria bacterium WSBS_2016_MAG_OTU1]
MNVFDILRFAFIGMLLYSLLVLWQRWEQWPPNPTNETGRISTSATPVPNANFGDDDIPPTATQPLNNTTNDDTDTPRSTNVVIDDGEIITVETDWLEVGISQNGGNLVGLRLKKHLDESGAPLAFLENGHRQHTAQSGLIGSEDLPNHRSVYTLQQSPLPLGDRDSLTVVLASQSGGIELIKRYVFERSKYMIQLQMGARNISDVDIAPQGYFQLSHNGILSTKESSFLPSFFGAVVYTDETKFNKISYEDIGDDDYPRQGSDGWVGMIQRYFAAVWLPDNDIGEREYYMRQGKSGARVGMIAPFGTIAPGAEKTLGMRLFAGAQEQDILNQLNEEGEAPGIHLVVDYGWLTVIAVLLFKLLAFIQTYVTNWGVAVISLTFLIKLGFYPLSSVSYRSIARMKQLSPRIKNLQETHKGDKQKMQQAMMAMYREKKINPLGGCLPILLQIPVFIALYWVILGSVELRMAPFYLWIEDLSASDPYFILPIFMGGAMFLQTRMSPAPPDPTQAMIIKIMPLFFSAFSLFFPAGLVLYWLVNTLLSIAQQWHISRSITRASKGSK